MLALEFAAGFLGVFVVGWLIFSPLWKRRKPLPEIRGDLNRFDFLGPVPEGNSIVEIRGHGRTLLRLDAYTFAMLPITLGRILISRTFGSKIEVLVDGRRQSPPPDR